MSDTVQEIKDKLSIVDVVGSYVKLTKAGKYHKGLCPFHKEKSASFMVSPERDFYHCFGCGKGGDIFSFVQDIENLDFKGALRLLAQKAGVTIEYGNRESTDEKEKLFSVLKSAEEFYSAQLDKKKDAKEYLLTRGLKPETLQRFCVGYAPNEWRALSEELQKQGYGDTLLEDAGLTKKPDEGGEGKRAYDRLRGRIMFPIRDISGRTVGFSGRIFPESSASGGATGQVPTTNYQPAKYINSPETKVFHKSRILYGLDMAREGIRKYGFAMLVEGQVDLLMAHQSGYTNAVALSGTSFTEAHAALIKRHTDNLLIAFDGDTAGIAAAGRAAALALQAGLNTKIARLPVGEDPADVIQHDPAAFKRVVRDAKHVVDFYLSHLRGTSNDARTFKLEASRIVLPFLSMIPNAIDREHFVGRVAESLQVSTDAVQNELVKIKNPNSTASHTISNETPEKTTAKDPFLSRSDTTERLLSGICLVFKERNDEERYARAHEALIAGLGEDAVTRLLENPEERRASIIEADLHLSEFDDPKAIDAFLDEIIHDFKGALLAKEQREKEEALKVAEASGATDDVARLVAEISDIAKQRQNMA